MFCCPSRSSSARSSASASATRSPPPRRSGKQLLALWNALPNVAKRKKVGDRAGLIDQLWSAIEALPDPEPQPDVDRLSKQDGVIAMLRRPEGATVDEVVVRADRALLSEAG